MADDVQGILDCVVVALGQLKGLLVSQLLTETMTTSSPVCHTTRQYTHTQKNIYVCTLV